MSNEAKKDDPPRPRVVLAEAELKPVPPPPGGMGGHASMSCDAIVIKAPKANGNN